jgi:lipopolysaccharide export LptBFGC system permease protein LptF
VDYRRARRVVPLLRIQRALLVELAVSLNVNVGVLTGIIFAGLGIDLVDRVGEGLGATILFDLMPKLLPTALVYSLPFGFLVTVSMVIGRWVNDHEVTSLRAAGLHLRTLVLPVLALSAVLGVVGMYIAAYVVPAAVRDVSEAKRDYLANFLGSLKDVSRSVSLGNGRLSFGRFEDGAFHDVEIDRRHPEGRLETKILAKRVALNQVRDEGQGAGLSIEIEEGYLVQADGGGTAQAVKPGTTVHFAQVEQLGGSTEFNSFFGLNRYLPRARELDLPSLLYAEARGGVWRSTPANVEIAIHGRLALGCAVIPMGMFALAMALLLPPSGRRVRDFLIAFVPATLIFFPLYLASPGLAASLPTSLAWLAMWSADLVLAALATVLLAVAYRR